MSARTTQFVLSRVDPRAAAFVTRLGKLDSWPSLDATLAGGAVAGVLMAAVNAGPVLSTLATIGLLALLIMPFVSSAIAAALASTDISGEEFALLKITNLEGRSAFQGYFLATMYRMRVPLALTLGGVLSMAGREIASTAAPTLTLFGLGLWSVCLLSATLTLEQAFRRYNPAETIVRGIVQVAPAFVVPFGPCVVVALLSALGSDDFWAPLPGSIAFAVFPYCVVYLKLVTKRELP